MAIDHMNLAPRCGARSKRTGNACEAPAMKNGRCRFHGGKSTGPAKGSQNALKHGMRSAEFVAWRKAANDVLRENRALIRGLLG